MASTFSSLNSMIPVPHLENLVHLDIPVLFSPVGPIEAQKSGAHAFWQFLSRIPNLQRLGLNLWGDCRGQYSELVLDEFVQLAGSPPITHLTIDAQFRRLLSIERFIVRYGARLQTLKIKVDLFVDLSEADTEGISSLTNAIFESSPGLKILDLDMSFKIRLTHRYNIFLSLDAHGEDARCEARRQIAKAVAELDAELATRDNDDEEGYYDSSDEIGGSSDDDGVMDSGSEIIFEP